LADATSVVDAFLQEAVSRQNFDRRDILQPYLAPAMTRRHADLFDACLQTHP
jgi:hypothetical protein